MGFDPESDSVTLKSKRCSQRKSKGTIMPVFLASSHTNMTQNLMDCYGPHTLVIFFSMLVHLSFTDLVFSFSLLFLPRFEIFLWFLLEIEFPFIQALIKMSNRQAF
jgi:hypothetical protein